MEFKLIVTLVVVLVSTSIILVRSDDSTSSTAEDGYIFDFTKTDGVEDWLEQSDTVRDVGTSKAALVIHQNVGFRRAVFFALLNPQSNGAAFAGVRALKTYNLAGRTQLQIQCRGQGQYNGFKIVLRHKGLNEDPNNTYEQFFGAPKDEFAVVSLPFSEFKAYFRGQQVNDAEALDLANVTSIGVQAYGGVYEAVSQSGPATLEIDWIRAV